jgi:hypothetical protein
LSFTVPLVRRWCGAGAGATFAVTAALLTVLTHWSPALAGLEFSTSLDNPTIAADTVVLRITGEIEPPMAEELAAGWRELDSRYQHLLIDLDTPGGSLTETEALVSVIAGIRARARVDTLVRHGALCASACVALFVQGEDRAAGGASVWLFHGACREPGGNLPSIGLTDRYLDILRQAGVADSFLCTLANEGYVTTPGDFWLSGYELYHVYKANVITRLLSSWRPELPHLPPVDPWIGPR